MEDQLKSESQLAKPKKSRYIIFAVLIILVFSNLFFAYSLYKKDHEVNLPPSGKEFDLIDPTIASMNLDYFLLKQKQMSVSYKSLKEKVSGFLSDKNSEYGVYFEDLTTGAWFGINEKEKYLPASLMKTERMTAILKKIQEGKLNFKDKISITKEDIDNRSGSLHKKSIGYETTIEDLITVMINESDNTALHALERQLTAREMTEAIIGLGLPLPEQGKNEATISPKEYSNIFRSLYFSAYLRRPFSQWALSLLANTKFHSQIPSGVPSNIKIAHKVGYLIEKGIFHDCGIVYLPNKPYILCIMSISNTEEKATSDMTEISRIIYDHISSK